MITSFIRAIPAWLNYQIWKFLKLLRSPTLTPPKPEFIHLENPAPVKPAVNGRRNRPQ